MPFLNRKRTILSDSSTQSYAKISQFQIPEMSQKFQFSFLTSKSCMEIKIELELSKDLTIAPL